MTVDIAFTFMHIANPHKLPVHKAEIFDWQLDEDVHIGYIKLVDAPTPYFVEHPTDEGDEVTWGFIVEGRITYMTFKLYASTWTKIVYRAVEHPKILIHIIT